MKWGTSWGASWGFSWGGGSTVTHATPIILTTIESAALALGNIQTTAADSPSTIATVPIVPNTITE